MKDMFPQFNRFFEYCSIAIRSDDNDKNKSFIESMPGWFDEFKSEPEYLNNAAAADLMINIDLEAFSTVKTINGSAIKPTKHQKIITDMIINFIINEVNNGESALLSSLCKLRYGYVMDKISNPGGNEIVSSLIRTSSKHDSNWFGLLAMRMAAVQPDERIAKGIGYTANHIELLQEIKTKEWLLKYGGNSIKRHLVSHDLGI
jgi:hypothetical protein